MGFWRFIWYFHDLYLDGPIFDRDDLTSSNLWAIGFGFCGTLLIDMFHHNFSNSSLCSRTFMSPFIAHVYSITWGIVDITYWKGVWDGINMWFGQMILVPSVTLAIGSIILVILGCVRTAICSPVSKSQFAIISSLNYKCVWK